MPKQPCPSSSVGMQWNKAQWNPSPHTPCILRRWSSSGKVCFRQSCGGKQEGRIQKYIWGTLRKEPQPTVSAAGNQCSSPEIRMGRDLFHVVCLPVFCVRRGRRPLHKASLTLRGRGNVRVSWDMSPQLGSGRCGIHVLSKLLGN